MLLLLNKDEIDVYQLGVAAQDLALYYKNATGDIALQIKI